VKKTRAEFAPKGQPQISPGQSGAAIAAQRRPGLGNQSRSPALKGRNKPEVSYHVPVPGQKSGPSCLQHETPEAVDSGRCPRASLGLSGRHLPTMGKSRADYRWRGRSRPRLVFAVQKLRLEEDRRRGEESQLEMDEDQRGRGRTPSSHGRPDMPAFRSASPMSPTSQSTSRTKPSIIASVRSKTNCGRCSDDMG
jgi:hypothetical protein